MSTQKEGTSTAAAARAIPYFTDLSSSVYQLKIALLTSASPSDMAKSNALQTNLDVDYVITYRFANTGMLASTVGRMKQCADIHADKAKAAAQFEKLCEALANVGLQTEVRNGDSHSLLLFVRVASDKHLFGEVYRSRSVQLVSSLNMSMTDPLQSPRLDPRRSVCCP
jgi:anoctamin-10